MYGAQFKAGTIFSTLILALFISQPDGVILPQTDHPESFYLVAAAEGVALYQRDSPGGNPDFVQLVHLNQGATVQLRHGSIAEPGAGQGAYGGDNPFFFTQTLEDVWGDFSVQHPDAFCLSNGQFFSVPAAATRLPFPLKIDGNVVSDGYGINQFPDHQLMLMMWPDRADIVPLSEAALYSSSAPNIVAGLSEEASGRRPNWPTGRTFVGVGGLRPDGMYETILIFNSRIARKTDAAGALRSFGAQKVMMLDGGASTQLICQGKSYIGPGRRIPQTIAVVAALSNSNPHRNPDPTWFVSCAVNETVVRTRKFPICL
jgi:hypothetical protein